ncbi:MAG: GFA family protein [Paracoccaceae bacterium]
MLTGSCECGAVTFTVTGPMRAVVACHCSQCRKTSGHYWAATSVSRNAMTITRDDGLKWFRSSKHARRGFCSGCGASLFWEDDGTGQISIGAGTLDGKTGLVCEKHIFVADKGDYYDIPDDMQNPESH